MWLSIAATLCFGVLWLWCARVNLTLLLPVYVVANALPTPWATTLEIYPDFGLGGLTRDAPTIGDALLVVTALAHPGVRAQLGRLTVPSALVAGSLVACLLALLRADVPVGTGLYLALVPARLGLALALMRVGLQSARSPLPPLAAVLATLSMFWAAAALMVVASATGLIAFFPLSELAGPDGRLSFPTLGNNKIGLTLLLLTAALGLLASRVDRTWAPALLPVAALLGILTSTAAQLRFSTTALALVLVVWVLLQPRFRWPGVLVGSLLGVLALRSGSLGEVRALSVITGGFEAGTDSSLNSRSELWGAALEIWQAHPRLGVVGEWEYRRPVSQIVFLGPLETHSDPLWVLATFGLVGLVGLVAVVWPIVRVSASWPVSATSLCAALALASLLLNVATMFPASAWALASLAAVASWWRATSEAPQTSGQGPDVRAPSDEAGRRSPASPVPAAGTTLMKETDREV